LLLSEIVEHFNQAEEFEDVREVLFQGIAARQEVAEAQRGVDWQMKTDDARCKLKSVYPKIKL